MLSYPERWGHLKLGGQEAIQGVVELHSEHQSFSLENMGGGAQPKAWGPCNRAGPCEAFPAGTPTRVPHLPFYLQKNISQRIN